MENNELLHAISKMMDEKLEPINNRLDNLEKGQINLQKGQANLEKGQINLEKSQANLEKGQINLEKSQANLQKGQVNLEKSQVNLEKGQTSLQQDMTEIKQRTTKIELILENDISKKFDALFDGHQLDSEKLTKLDTIEKTVDETKDTVDVLFKVVQGHSGEIKKIKLVR